MPNPPLPLPATTIQAAWGQAVTTRVVNVYQDAATRDAAIPTPEDGQLAYLLDDDALTVRIAGVLWVTVGVGTFVQVAGDTMEGDLNLGGHEVRGAADIKGLGSLQLVAGPGGNASLTNNAGHHQVSVRDNGDILLLNHAGNEVFRWDEAAEEFIFTQDIGGQFLVEVLKAQVGARIGMFGDTSARMVLLSGGDIQFLNSAGNETRRFDTGQNKWVFATPPVGV